jgi:hypothetical protein
MDAGCRGNGRKTMNSIAIIEVVVISNDMKEKRAIDIAKEM